MDNTQFFNTVALRDTTFASLMNKRVYNVLLIATKYDLFMLEEDNRVDAQIFNEYIALNLRYPPRFTQVTTEDETFAELARQTYQLIIMMPNMVEKEIFPAAKEIKRLYPTIPIVVLSPFSKEVSKRIANEDLSDIDYIFSWLGNSDLLVAIVKLIEDKMNSENDVASAGVQIILLIEDSVRFYSSALPYLYKFVLEQSQKFAEEALNDHLKTLRMRGRPKIKLARTYEEAMRIFTKYQDNILGIISDMNFPAASIQDPKAGYRFGKYVKKIKPTIPLIIVSSEIENKLLADELNSAFINKNTKTYPQELRLNVMESFGFGDFIIINPKTKEEVMRIKNLKDLHNKLFQIPEDSLAYHLAHNHFSRFFYSRAMFPPAELLSAVNVNDYTNVNVARQFILDVIVAYRRMKNTGVVAVYQRDRYDEYSNFARIGEGSLGGKGRGLAFIGTMLKRYPQLEKENLAVKIPQTVVLCTDIFDEFMETNGLYSLALSDTNDEIILESFLQASLPNRIFEDLEAFIQIIKKPIAVRSSSLLEDAHYQPFAGIYSTYMIPNLSDKDEMLRALSDAIKGVYASVFFQHSKLYIAATRNLIDQEKMSVVLQEVVGTQFKNRLYPIISGTARSLNFYPIGNEKSEDGIANIALGLGKYIVDGGTTLRFSPRHPRNVLQMSSLKYALKETQTNFLALDLENLTPKISINDGFNLLKLNLKDADADGALNFISSTYDPHDQIIREGYYPDGRKILSFVNILEHELFPLSEMIDRLLIIGQKEMGRPVEIEFAVDIQPNNRQKATFYYLQLRPIVNMLETINENLKLIDHEQTILFSNNALGHGVDSDICDILYVKTENFDPANNELIANEIEKINKMFSLQDKYYVLVGPGRWGSEDSWLGIPIKWTQICNAKLIVECSLDKYRIDPSQGTHFFQNLTSCGVGYFTINQVINDGYFAKEYLDAQKAIEETQFLRLVRFDNPIVIKIDGRQSIGVVMK